MAVLSRATIVLLFLAIQRSAGTVGVVDINNLLYGESGQQLLSEHKDTGYAPWSHEPYCAKSKVPETLGEKYCVFTSNTTGPHGLSLLFQPGPARRATRHLNDNPIDAFLTRDEATKLYGGGGPPWKVVQIPGKDLGVVAIRKIRKFETFMIDQAAVVMDTDFEKAFSPRQAKKMLKVAVDRLLEPKIIRDMSSMHDDQGSHGAPGEHEHDGIHEEESEEEDGGEVGKLENDIMRTNGFGSTVADTAVTALYPLISRANHACDPNSYVLFSKAGVSMSMKAYRDIDPGEEITVSYLQLGMPYANRQRQIKRWGFKCTCSLCMLPERQREASDLRRKMIIESEKKVIEYAEQDRADEAIELAEECIHLLLEENLYTMLTDTYTMLAMLWLSKGDKKKAEIYGRQAHLLLADLGYLGVDGRKEEWTLQTLFANIDKLGGKGKQWKKKK